MSDELKPSVKRSRVTYYGVLLGLAIAIAFFAVRSCRQEIVVIERASILAVFHVQDLVVDNTAKVSGPITACTGVTSGCVAKPNMTFNPTTGHFAIDGTGADWSTIRSLTDSIETLGALEHNVRGFV